jgi:hypothetical protein
MLFSTSASRHHFPYIFSSEGLERIRVLNGHEIFQEPHEADSDSDSEINYDDPDSDLMEPVIEEIDTWDHGMQRAWLIQRQQRYNTRRLARHQAQAAAAAALRAIPLCPRNDFLHQSRCRDTLAGVNVP